MYRAHRDYRFEYAHDVVQFIEAYQCHNCAFRQADNEDPMCDEIAIGLLMEEPLEALDDRGEHGVVCTRYRSVDDYTHPDPLQMELFD